MKEKAIEGYEFKIPKQDEPIESFTLNSKLFNELRKKHNVQTLLQRSLMLKYII